MNIIIYYYNYYEINKYMKKCVKLVITKNL
jgi:hypothetical protein